MWETEYFMNSIDKLLMLPLNGYFGVYFPVASQLRK